MFPQKKLSKLKGVVSKKRVVVAITVLIAAALIVALATYFATRNSDQANDITPETVCSDDIIKRANEQINNSTLNELTATADEVKKIAKYDRDDNCLYIVVRYGLMIGDSRTARDSYEQLKRVFDGYSPLFTSQIQPDELEPLVEYAEKRQKDRDEAIKKQVQYESSLSEDIGPGFDQR